MYTGLPAKEDLHNATNTLANPGRTSSIDHLPTNSTAGGNRLNPDSDNCLTLDLSLKNIDFERQVCIGVNRCTYFCRFEAFF